MTIATLRHAVYLKLAAEESSRRHAVRSGDDDLVHVRTLRIEAFEHVLGIMDGEIPQEQWSKAIAEPEESRPAASH